MKQFSKDLGNVSLAPKGRWSKEQEYERLNLVYNACDNLSYVAKIDVPIGVEIDNREYWQPMNATGYADNNFINLTAENENGAITAYETLEEAVATILPINRRAGATLSFYNLNSDRLDRQAEFELWQFNSTDLANWENRDYWNNIYYNWNVFAGWYVGADGLKNHVKIPNVGQYAYVGTNLNDALLYQCRTNGTWTNTGIKVRNYISVVVSGNITIGENGNWYNNGEDTGIPATPAVDEQLDNIIIQLQQHATEIDELQRQDVILKSNIDSNFETINNKVDNIKTATDNKIDTADANLQNQITSNDTDIATLNTKHESLSKTVQGIAATGGASTATNVTYNNDNSGLNALNVQDAIDEVSSMVTYDVSARNGGIVFESLQSLLSSNNLSTLIPTAVRCGGMSIRFIQSSDNKYVQYRLMANSFTTDVTQWYNDFVSISQNIIDGKTSVQVGGNEVIYAANGNIATYVIGTVNTIDVMADATLVEGRRIEVNGDEKQHAGYNYYKITNNGYINIFGTASAYYSMPLIAFYNSNNIDSASFIGSLNSVVEYFDGESYNTPIPEGCVTIVVMRSLEDSLQIPITASCQYRNGGIKKELESIQFYETPQTTSKKVISINARGQKYNIRDEEVAKLLNLTVSESASINNDSILQTDGNIYTFSPYTDGNGVSDFIPTFGANKITIEENCWQYDKLDRFAAIVFFNRQKIKIGIYQGSEFTEVRGIIDIPFGTAYIKATLHDMSKPLIYHIGGDVITDLENPKMVVSFDSTNGVFSVYQHLKNNLYTCLTINHLIDSNNLINLWRIATSGGIYSYRSGVFTYMNKKLLNSPENEFAMKFNNRCDFIGGFHGNERIDVNDGFAKFYIDGIEYPDLTSDFSIECNSFYMLQKSTLYMNGTTSQQIDGNPIVGTHYKKTVFCDNGYECENRVIFDLSDLQESSLQVETWYTGLCCVSKDCATSAYAEDFIIRDTSDGTHSYHIDNAYGSDVVMMNKNNGLSCKISSQTITENNNNCEIVIWDRPYGDTKYYRYAPTRTIETGDIFMNKQKVSFDVV